ncbi:hypothetical protein SmJEL517_g02055 [Synchytrium microbalum]|uniref:N-acetyltransferase domain-containing protein n=1 Tax=Synchytrium microbalum TaxID=1806994 RepID=A0A507CD57_9FUNG|nr:uncharacterized protein SmJEL517_g02055 [Synchytrium microbalum]TPX35473.1 hypothetical protein SmJEL517_g02055 [Synchytrium microbalum]
MSRMSISYEIYSLQAREDRIGIMEQVVMLSADDAAKHLPEFIDLLRDSVENGGSIGFVIPMELKVAESFWLGVFEDVQTGNRKLLAILSDQGVASRSPAETSYITHRAEVQKLLVHSSKRKNGLGSRLMEAVEDLARKENRRLLVLDTIEENIKFYQRLKWNLVGEIPEFALSPYGTDRDADSTYVFYKLLRDA